jgi:hypothetical protein
VLARPTRWLDLLVVAAFLLLAPACRRPSPTGEQLDRRVQEPSGIVASRKHVDIFWTHGDSGRAPKLYAVDRQGALIAELTVADVDNVDWEAIALDDQGNLWIGDIGNNASNRTDLVVYRIGEPDPYAGLESVGVDHRVRFCYPDQDDFSDSRGPFDAEALFWWSGSLWLATKHRQDTLTVLYRFPQVDIDEVVLERVSEWDLGTQLGDGHPASNFPGMATGADVSIDQKQLALLSYDAVFVFELTAGQRDPFAGKVHRIALNPSYVDQVEAVTWEGEQLLLVNESGALFRITEVRTRQRYPDE